MRRTLALAAGLMLVAGAASQLSARAGRMAPSGPKRVSPSKTLA